jgi:DNA-binding GntR family transcriptional regulator
VSEIYTLRALLEPRCVAAAVRRLDDAALKNLEQLAAAMDSPTSPAESSLARRRFYRELYALSGQPRTADVILRLRDDVHRYHVMNRTHPHNHNALLERLRNRDAAGAARVMRAHLAAAAKDLVARIEREEAESGASDGSLGARDTQSS